MIDSLRKKTWIEVWFLCGCVVVEGTSLLDCPFVQSVCSFQKRTNPKNCRDKRCHGVWLGIGLELDSTISTNETSFISKYELLSLPNHHNSITAIPTTPP